MNRPAALVGTLAISLAAVVVAVTFGATILVLDTLSESPELYQRLRRRDRGRRRG